MGFGSKLTVAFVTVILAMTLVQAGCAFFLNMTQSKSAAKKSIETVKNNLGQALQAMQQQNLRVAKALASDGSFKSAVLDKDKAGTAAAVKAFCDRTAFAGFVAVVRDGKVFYSSDIPKSGYQVASFNFPFFDQIFIRGADACTVCAPTEAGVLALAGGVPLMGSGPRPEAAVVAFEPFQRDMLVGLQKQLEFGPAQLKGFDLVFLSPKDARVIATNPELARVNKPFIDRLNQKGEQSPVDDQEQGGRLWGCLQLFAPDGKRGGGRIYVSVPTTDPIPQTLMSLGQLAAGAAAAFVLSLLFSAGIAKRFDNSMRMLKQRAKDLAENKQNLRSLADLGGEWVELAEMMDTAVNQPRASVMSLRQTVGKKDEELVEKQRQVEAINNQLEAMNRQLTSNNRQAVDINNQVNTANLQAALTAQKLSAVLQVSTEGYLLLDPYGSVLSANPMFLNWLGVQEREIAGRFCFDLVKKPGEPRDSRTMQQVRPQIPGELINLFYPEGVVYHRNNEKYVEVLIHLQPVVTDDSTIQGYTMVMRDKSVHSELNRLRNEVVAMLRDDIRRRLSDTEPIWNTVMNSQLKDINPAAAQGLVSMQKTYTELLGIVDSYLMMYGGFVPTEVVQQQQQQRGEPVSITRLIGECLEQVSPSAREQQIMLDYKTVTGLPNTATNKDIVRDVITQLLEKMICVTAPGGRVRAETAVKGQEIRLIISSSGPAVQADEIEDMFVGFIDGKHGQDTYQTRLSMYLARSNAERLGGKVWAESEAGRGTAIFLTLPVH